MEILKWVNFYEYEAVNVFTTFNNGHFLPYSLTFNVNRLDDKQQGRSECSKLDSQTPPIICPDGEIL